MQDKYSTDAENGLFGTVFTDLSQHNRVISHVRIVQRSRCEAKDLRPGLTRNRTFFQGTIRAGVTGHEGKAGIRRSVQ
jgi:hypothetical protein